MNWQIKQAYGEYYLQCNEYSFYLDTTDKREAHYWLAMADIYVLHSLQNLFLEKKGYTPTIYKRAV